MSALDQMLSIFDEATRIVIRSDIQKMERRNAMPKNGSDVIQWSIPAEMRMITNAINVEQMVFDALQANGEQISSDFSVPEGAESAAYEMFAEYARKRLETDVDFQEKDKKNDENYKDLRNFANQSNM
ncbi:unnamed protein product [Caenorhabditis bovis]|uniref:Uncharacterized protein n=1 Tax=Caenorhabditis bovis TaxID=2654633 RepID=A0A8S1EZN3_9PELO|nr:unnamed protein product [Caenorhabditis bovis]